MSQKSFVMTAALLFGLVAIGHLLRIAFDASVVVRGVSIPMWVSWIALFVAAFLAYEGFRLGKSLRRI